MPSIMIHASVDSELDAKARRVLANMGLSMNDAIALFLNNIVEGKKIPFAVDVPNEETLAAIEDAANGKVERYPSLEAMWADLDNA